MKQISGYFTTQLPVVKTCLKGFSQIMLQENATTGLLFLSGIFWGSPIMGFASCFSVLVGTLTAIVLKFSKSESEQGLYGFSAALTGAGLVLFLGNTFTVWVLVLLGAVVSAVLQHTFIQKKIAAFTFPFILSTWVLVFFARQYLPHLINPPVTETSSFSSNYLFAVLGYAEVIFQNNFVSGVLFLAGVFISSPKAAIYGFLGAVLAGVIAWGLPSPHTEVSMGLFSYNAVLCAIVFAGAGASNAVWASFSVILAVLIGFLMFKFNLMQLTFPFVASVWLCLALQKLYSQYLR